MVRSWYIAGLIALVIAIRALVPAGFMLSPSSLANGAMTVVVCTSSGLKLMHLDKDGQPVEQPEHAIADEPCSYGPPTMVTSALEPIAVAIERRASKIAHQRFIAFVSSNRHRIFRLARAPPYNA